MNSEIRVPEGMRERSRNAKHSEGAAYGVGFEDGMLFACHDLYEHPIVPTDEQAEVIAQDVWAPQPQVVKAIIDKWQRRMFRAEEDVSEAVKHLLTPENMHRDFNEGKPFSTWAPESHDKAVLEAYRLGQKSK